MIAPLIVLVAVAPVMAPERFKIVTPDKAPAVDTFKPLDTKWKVPVALPMIVSAFPDALIDADPVA